MLLLVPGTFRSVHAPAGDGFPVPCQRLSSGSTCVHLFGFAQLLSAVPLLPEDSSVFFPLFFHILKCYLFLIGLI